VVSQKIGAWIARLGWVWVDGQVAQISRRPGNTTVFLTLRDPSADISLTVTTNRDVLDSGAPNLTEGARIVLHAKPDFYAGRGALSLRADEVRQVGLGELLARLERLKKLLAAEGLFDPARKRRPPFLPTRVGLVTGRVPQIVDALKVLDADPAVDVIVLARGGGSTEDLLPFSDEALCRAVFACHTPVVSAIGHETDVPLLDFVADVRASTPTDAAKRIVPDFAEEQRTVHLARQRLDRAVSHLLDRERQFVQSMRTRPALARPEAALDTHAEDIAGLLGRADRCLRHRLDRADTELHHTLARLRALSPAATLQRGYAVVQRVADGQVVRTPAAVEVGEELRVRLAKGELAVSVVAGGKA
jgi:exodeoxyribonuclease VII large subunit